MDNKSPIKIHGGKSYLAEWIISHFPPHIHYVEPFFGGGSVLLSKKPSQYKNVSEVVNDIHLELTNFWQVLQSPEEYPEFHRLCEVTPFSEVEFCLAKNNVPDPSITPRVRRAWKFFILARQSRQGLQKDFATLSRNRTRRGINEQISAWLSAIEGLEEIHKRLRTVVVLHDKAVNVIRKQDGPNTFFYLDPPYLHETRETTKDYLHEMEFNDHVALLKVLATIQGKFALSGYPSQLYHEYQNKHGWACDSKTIDAKSSSQDEKPTRVECLWMNYDWRSLK